MTNCKRNAIVQAFALASICGSLISVDGYAASFDCGKATIYAEKAVCEDVELSELDELLFASYHAAYADPATASQKKLKLAQQRWLKERDACRDRVCVKTAYQTRLADLNDDSECPVARCTRFVETGLDRKLWAAADRSDTTGAKAALSKGAAPNVCGASYERPLHMAVNRRNPALVRELLNSGAKPNFMNCPGNTPLILAAHDNNVEIAVQLLAAGADIEMGWGISPLQMAASHGHIDMLKTLLAHGANPNAICGNSTALLFAASDLRVEAVRLLLDAGANPNFGVGFSATPLFQAVGAFRTVPPSPEGQEQALEVVRMLVQHGADVNARTAGHSPLQRARALNELTIVDYLTKAGAEP